MESSNAKLANINLEKKWISPNALGVILFAFVQSNVIFARPRPVYHVINYVLLQIAPKEYAMAV